jgi:predicted NBD/HSP70 family sugar kinase
MYLAVDIGGTKTLLAAFSRGGQQLAALKLPTPSQYEKFLKALADSVVKLSTEKMVRACIAVPGRLDRARGMALGYGNLKWGERHIQKDLERLLGCPVIIENDAKLAGLSEARNLSQYENVLYVTIGTGISCALITNGRINPGLEDSEAGQMLVEHAGKMVAWEDVSSGKAIVKRYGKKARDINDAAIWRIIAREQSLGLINLISVIQPDVVVIGGGVGANFSKFAAFLEKELKRHETPLIPIPPIKPARHPEKAVIHGCWELLSQADENR